MVTRDSLFWRVFSMFNHSYKRLLFGSFCTNLFNVLAHTIEAYKFEQTKRLSDKIARQSRPFRKFLFIKLILLEKGWRNVKSYYRLIILVKCVPEKSLTDCHWWLIAACCSIMTWQSLTIGILNSTWVEIKKEPPITMVNFWKNFPEWTFFGHFDLNITICHTFHA